MTRRKDVMIEKQGLCSEIICQADRSWCISERFV